MGSNNNNADFIASLDEVIKETEQKEDYVTFQAKLKRNLVNDFETVRRGSGKTKKELLEDFIHWCKYEYLDNQGFWQFGEAFINASEKED